MNQTEGRTRASGGKGRSEVLGRLEVRRDRTGWKLLAHGVVYAVQARRKAETPTPWLVLGASPWMLSARPSRKLRIALLGYGAGTVARLIRAADPSAELTGVEPDPEVRRLARRMKGDEAGASIVATDARTFLARPGPRYDLLLDDIFQPVDGRLGRPADLWNLPRMARRRLLPGGIYGVNLCSPGSRVEQQTVRSVLSSFRHALLVHTREYAHKIVLGSDRPFRRGALGEGLRQMLGDPGSTCRRAGVSRVRGLSGLGIR